MDRSDARQINADGSSGSGIGYAPVGADGRTPGEEIEGFGVSNPSAGGLPIGMMISDDDTWPDDPSDARGRKTDGDLGSGAQQGSPELEYQSPDLFGMSPVDVSPLDGGMSDPIRDGNTPARMAIGRFLFLRKAMQPDIAGDYNPRQSERVIIGEIYHGAQQPYGRMSPMDEYRLLGDGAHA